MNGQSAPPQYLDTSWQSTPIQSAMASTYVPPVQPAIVGLHHLPLSGLAPSGTGLVPSEPNMNLMYQNASPPVSTQTGLVFPSLAGQVPMQPLPNQFQVLGQTNSPTSPLTPTTGFMPMSPLAATPNGLAAPTAQDGDIQLLLEQQQQQLQQYRALQLQQQQLQQQQQLIQEHLSRLPHTPPVSTQLATQGGQGWQFQQDLQSQAALALGQTFVPQQPASTLVTASLPPQDIQLPGPSPQHAQQQISQAQVPQYNTHAPTVDEDAVDAPKIAAAPPHTYIPNPISPRQNTLPSSLPTSLNPSLKVKSSFGIDTDVANQPPARPGFWEATKIEGYQDDHNTSGVGSSVASSLSPTGSSPTSPSFGRSGEYTIAAYERPPTKDACLRCLQKVYTMEQVGPIKGVLYHKHCFVCAVCGTRLNLKNFQHNPNDMDDLSVYCSSHRPRERAGACDASAVLIKTAMGVPKLHKVNEQIRTDKHSPRLGLDRKHSVVSASLPQQKEQYFYGMGSQQEQKGHSEQRQHLMQLHQELQDQQAQVQQSMKLLEQHQQQLNSDYHNEAVLTESSRKNSSVSTSSQTGDSGIYSPTKCHSDDVFAPNLSSSSASSAGQANKKSGSPGGVASPMSSASSSLSSATGANMSKRPNVLPVAVEDGLVNDLNNKLSMTEEASSKGFMTPDRHSGQESTATASSSAASSPQVVMRRSDRPSSLEDQNERDSAALDRISIGSCASNASGGRDSLDGAAIVGVPLGQKVSTPSLERTDRPSSRSSNGSTGNSQQRQYNRQCSNLSTASTGSTGSGRDLKDAAVTSAPEIEKAARAGKVGGLVKSRSELDFELQKKERDTKSRFLPRNESMRMDRPSQYS